MISGRRRAPQSPWADRWIALATFVRDAMAALGEEAVHRVIRRAPAADSCRAGRAQSMVSAAVRRLAPEEGDLRERVRCALFELGALDLERPPFAVSHVAPWQALAVRLHDRSVSEAMLV